MRAGHHRAGRHHHQPRQRQPILGQPLLYQAQGLARRPPRRPRYILPIGQERPRRPGPGQYRLRDQLTRPHRIRQRTQIRIRPHHGSGRSQPRGELPTILADNRPPARHRASARRDRHPLHREQRLPRPARRRGRPCRTGRRQGWLRPVPLALEGIRGQFHPPPAPQHRRPVHARPGRAPRPATPGTGPGRRPHAAASLSPPERAHRRRRRPPQSR